MGALDNHSLTVERTFIASICQRLCSKGGSYASSEFSAIAISFGSA
jgi:hypothetical protein